MPRSYCHITRCIFILTIFLYAGCNSLPAGHITQVFDEVENCINVQPDSALVMLQRIDSTALTGPAVKARYALLKTMAQDKCFMDITMPGLLDPAVAWYTKFGSADEKLKVQHYQGRIQQDLGNQKAAIVAYSRAEKYVDRARDKHAVGVLYAAIGSVYNSVYNREQELLYKEKASAVFKQADDPMYGSSLGSLALAYQNKKEWARADSLYRIGIAASEAYPQAQKSYIFEYARMKLIQPEKDPEGALELLNRGRETSGGLSPRDAGAYAYAAELVGDKRVADALLPQLQEIFGDARVYALMWISRIALARGDYEQALKSWTEAYNLNSANQEAVLTESVTKALQEEAARETAQTRSRLHAIGFGVCFLILACLCLALWQSRKKYMIELEYASLVNLREHLQEELNKKELILQEIRTEKAAQSQMISNQQAQILEMEERVARERETYTRERVARLRQLGELRSTFWWREHGGMRESEAILKIKEEIAFVYQTDNDGRMLIRQLDKELDGAISSLRTKLHLRGKPREVLFLCCCILDLEPEMIAEIMDTTKANVYEKRSRLRLRIRELGDPLLSVLVEKGYQSGR